MKNPTRIEWSKHATSRTKQASSTGKNGIAVLSVLLLAMLFTTACIGLTGVPKGSSNQGNTSPAATISVAPASIRFGSVPLGETASQSVTISNRGASSVQVTKASSTAAGFAISGISLPLTIGAGKQSTFNVIFSPKSPGAVSGDISLVSDASGSPTTVTLSGTAAAATPLLTTSTSTLGFGDVAIGKSGLLSVTLTNAGNSNVAVSKVSGSGAPYSGSGISAGMILSPGQSATLEETFTPTATGNFTGSVMVVSNASNSPATISLSGNGTQTGSHSVELAWTPGSSDAGFDVFRSVVSGGPYSKLNSTVVVGSTYVDSTVQGGQTYYYVVAAISSAGMESATSVQASATIPSP